MAWRLIPELYNSFTKVGINDLNSFSVQEFIQATFFREHGFALYYFLDLMLLNDVENNIVMFCSINCPMYRNAIGLCIIFKFDQVIIKIRKRMVLYLRSPFPQQLPLCHTMGSLISFLPHKPQSL